MNGLSFVAVIVALLALRVRPIVSTGASMLQSMKEGISFMRSQKGMQPLVWLAFFMTMLGVPLVVFLPVIAKDVFHRGSDTYTLLLSVSGVGAIAGALLVAAFGHIHNKGQATLQTLIVLGGLIAGFALSKNLLLSCVLLFLAGAALIAVFAMISSLVQLIAPDDMRGRVMSVYNVAFRGGMPIGSFLTGLLAERISAPAVLAANGVLLGLLGIYFLFVQRRVAEL